MIKREGTDQNIPTQKAMELKLFEIKQTPIIHSTGDVTIAKTTKVTGKGQQYFIRKFLDVKQTYQLYRDYLDNFRINSRR